MVRTSEFAVELVELLAIVIGSGTASFVGVELERTAAAGVASGEFVVAGWALVMGLVALYVGVIGLGYEQALPRLRALVGAA